MVTYILLIYLLWYLPYAPIHEGSHYLGGRLTGLHATSYQFMPHFWKGDFVNGFIQWGESEPWQVLVSTQAPYVVDGLLVVFGFLLFRRPKGFGPFLGAFLLMQVFLRSVFDVAVNYVAGALRGTGDFHHMLHGYPPIAVHFGAWAVMLLGVFGAYRLIRSARPEGALAAS